MAPPGQCLVTHTHLPFGRQFGQIAQGLGRSITIVLGLLASVAAGEQEVTAEIGQHIEVALGLVQHCPMQYGWQRLGIAKRL